MRATWFALLLAPMSLLGLIACGGNTRSMCLSGPCPEQGGSVGAPQGGQSSAGRASSGGNTSGGAPGFGGNTSGGAAGCCLALAICDDGDQTLTPGSACPSGAECYSRTLCCSTVYCARALAQCDAVPTCDSGDTQISGECPPEVQCYSRTLCGKTVNCRSSCGSQEEVNRRYVSRDINQCALVDFTCQAETQSFVDECGCGCEQDSSCPAWVDCQPRSDQKPLDPLCTDREKCPFSPRAL